MPRGGTLQAALVLESERPDAFCMIATEQGGAPHKMTAKYQQQQTVLSCPLTVGESYTMTTRCITQQQQPSKQTPLKIYLYTTRPISASAQKGHPSIRLLPEAQAKAIVCKATAEQIIYGAEAVPEDTKRQVSADKDAKAVDYDPAVLKVVIDELEEQRDHLCEFARAELKGQPPAILDKLRKDNQDQRARVSALSAELNQLRAVAAAAKADPSDPLSGAINHLERGASHSAAAMEQKLQEVQQLNAQLNETVQKMGSGGDGAMQALHAQLVQTQRELAAAQAQLSALEAGGKKGSQADSDKLMSELQQLKDKNQQLKKQLEEVPKSAACVLL